MEILQSINSASEVTVTVERNGQECAGPSTTPRSPRTRRLRRRRPSRIRWLSRKSRKREADTETVQDAEEPTE